MATATQNENVNNMNMQETGKKRKQSNPSNQREKRSNPFPSNEQFEYLERRCDEAKSKLINAKAEMKELLYQVEIECRVAGRLGRAIPEELALALTAADAYSESESINKIESPGNRQETSRDHQTGMHRGVNPFPGASGPPMQTFRGPVPLGRHSRENPLPGRFEPPIRTFGGPVPPGRHCRSWREFSKGKKELKETQKKVDQATELVARLKGAIQLMKSTEKICESRLVSMNTDSTYRLNNIL
jgi:hypothetical protein